jgi:autotransporter-associated beta strand protein
MRTASPEDQLTFLGWAHAYGGATTLDQGIVAYYPKDTPTWAVVVAKDIR